MSRLRWTALLVLALVLWRGAPPGTRRPRPSRARASRSARRPRHRPPPRSASCHALSVTEATDPVDTGGPVPCRQAAHVGDRSRSASSPRSPTATCSRSTRRRCASRSPTPAPTVPGAFVGGDQTTQRLSRFEVVWFSPSLEQADAGANWYRCDVVALRSEGKLLPLPARLQGVLDQDGALDRFGTCGTAAPDERGFARVVCSREALLAGGRRRGAAARRALPRQGRGRRG